MVWLAIKKFLSAAFTWITMNWKLALYIGGGLAILLCIRLYGNAQWAKGVDFGDARTQKKMEDAEKKRWEVAQKEIDQEKKQYQTGVQQNENYRKVLAAQATEIERARIMLERTAAEIKATAAANIKSGYTLAQSLNDRDTLNSIRAISRALEADHNWRDRIPINSGATRTPSVPPPK